MGEQGPASGATLPVPQGSAEGATGPLAPTAWAPVRRRAVALTVTVAGGGRGWAASAGLSGAPLPGVRAGGWGVVSGLQQGFYGARSQRQEGPWALTLR